MAHKIYKNIHLVQERSKHYFKHYFISQGGNQYRPKILQPNLLRAYSILLILVKVALTGFLFLSYPTYGEFASFTSGQIIELTNVERQKSGLSALSANALLSKAAANKAQDMLAKGYFDHTGPDGSRPWDWISSAGYGYLYAGENLAKDFTNAASTVAALMNSASHKKNILNENYKDIGVAVADGLMNGKQTIVMVQFFGALTAPAPAPEPAVVPKEEPKSEPAPAPAPEPAVVPKEEPKSEPAPEPDIYEAELVDQSDNALQLASGVSTNIWAEFKNSGNTVWQNDGNNYIALNVTDPTGRQSPFQHENWLEYYRPMAMKSDQILPGETERFEFPILAPEEPGTYNESYGLVAENKTWIEGGSFTVSIIVSQPQQVKPAETSEPTNTNQALPIESTDRDKIDDFKAEVTTAITPTQETFAEQLTVGQNTGWAWNLIVYSQRFFLALFIFLIIALLINIFVNIRVQHYPTIFRTLLVIILAGLMYFTRIHFAEAFGNFLNLI